MASKASLALIAVFLLSIANAYGQCGRENTAFQSGEEITYDLYFNWGIIAKKVGTASFKTVGTTYKGQQAFRTELLANTNRTADAIFKMRDTLTSIVSTRMEPLYYRKGSEENDRYTIDEVFYSYANGVSHVDMQRFRRGSDEITHDSADDSRCIFDMVSIMAWARSVDPATLRNGERQDFPLASGSHVEEGTLVYYGKKNLDAKDGHTYRTLVYSYITHKDGKSSEIIRFYVSDDDNHLPLRLDLSLKFGSARVHFKSVVGNRYPLSSRIK